MKRRKKVVRKSTSSLLSLTEHAEQVGFVNWFRDKFPTVLIFAVPNGGKRTPGAAKKLKAEGVVAGIPDLYVPEWNLWIEMKRVKGGVLSKVQKDVIAYLETIGHTVIIGRGARGASEQVLEFISEHRAINSG